MIHQIKNVRYHINSLFPQLTDFLPFDGAVFPLYRTLFTALLGQIAYVALQFDLDPLDNLAVVAVGCSPVQSLCEKVSVYSRRMTEAQNGARRKKRRYCRQLGYRIQSKQKVVEGKVGWCSDEYARRQGSGRVGGASEKLQNKFNEGVRFTCLCDVNINPPKMTNDVLQAGHGCRQPGLQ